MTAINPEVADWIAGHDPGLEWQVRRDLLDEPPESWGPVRAEVETRGWGAQLLAQAGDDGLWAGGTFVPDGFTQDMWRDEGQPWTATYYAMADLRMLGLVPTSAAAVRMVDLVDRNGHWDHAGERYWGGEVEECINGQTVAAGCYFGVDMSGLVTRLVGEEQSDGGWNCERAEGSMRSSFDTTMCVLEGLLEFERATGGTPASTAARERGEEYLLERRLMYRLSTGEIVDPDYLVLRHPHRWRYDILRALDYFRSSGQLTGRAPDPRLTEALDLVAAAQGADGRWPTQPRLPGRQWFEYNGPAASAWVTLFALRVLRWAGR